MLLSDLDAVNDKARDYLTEKQRRDAVITIPAGSKAVVVIVGLQQFPMNINATQFATLRTFMQNYYTGRLNTLLEELAALDVQIGS